MQVVFRVAVVVCITAGLALAAASRPLAVWLCRLILRVDESWSPIVRNLVALVGVSLASIGAVLLVAASIG